MRRHASEIAPGGGIFWNGGGETFIHKGTNGRWRDTLPEELSERYEEIAREKLGEECAAWLAHGSQN